MEYQDQPTVRAVVADAEDNDYRMSSFILGVVMSDAFQMKQAQEEVDASVAADKSPITVRP